MIQIVWEFRVRPGAEGDFERHYGPDGTWVQLFRRSPDYVRTLLLCDVEFPGRYLTVDFWTSSAAYDAFRQQFAGEYKTIDGQMEALTLSENKIGIFHEIPMLSGEGIS